MNVLITDWRGGQRNPQGRKTSTRPAQLPAIKRRSWHFAIDCELDWDWKGSIGEDTYVVKQECCLTFHWWFDWVMLKFKCV